MAQSSEEWTEFKRDGWSFSRSNHVHQELLRGTLASRDFLVATLFPVARFFHVLSVWLWQRPAWLARGEIENEFSRNGTGTTVPRDWYLITSMFRLAKKRWSAGFVYEYALSGRSFMKIRPTMELITWNAICFVHCGETNKKMADRECGQGRKSLPIERYGKFRGKIKCFLRLSLLANKNFLRYVYNNIYQLRLYLIFVSKLEQFSIFFVCYIYAIFSF